MDPLPDETTTSRLTLRRWRAKDAELLHTAITESANHLRPWMPWIAQEPLTVDERRTNIEKWSEEWAAGGDSVMGVFIGETAVGGCGLHRRVGPGGLEIGYWIHVDHTNRGYATELARGLTDAAFTIDSIARVEIHHDKANEFSGRVPKRLGYTMTAETADEILAPAETGTSWTWTVTRTDWQAASTGE